MFTSKCRYSLLGMQAPNGLAFSCRERAGQYLQNANDLAREAVSCNAGLDGRAGMVSVQGGKTISLVYAHGFVMPCSFCRYAFNCRMHAYFVAESAVQAPNAAKIKAYRLSTIWHPNAGNATMRLIFATHT